MKEANEIDLRFQRVEMHEWNSTEAKNDSTPSKVIHLPLLFAPLKPQNPIKKFHFASCLNSCNNFSQKRAKIHSVCETLARLVSKHQNQRENDRESKRRLTGSSHDQT